MKYLKQITLKNFQSHKDSTIQLDRGLNAIIGPSDSGKSAIIRAIKWVLYNEPSGDFFIRALAIEVLCFWPPERVTPLSPKIVSNLFGKFCIFSYTSASNISIPGSFIYLSA